MFYIDQVLYRHLLPEKEFKPTPSTSTSAATMVTTLPPDVEIIDQETTTDSELGTETAYPDLLLEEDTTKKVVSNQAWIKWRKKKQETVKSTSATQNGDIQAKTSHEMVAEV